MQDPKIVFFEEMLSDVRKKQVIAKDELVRLDAVEAYARNALEALGGYGDPPTNGVPKSAEPQHVDEPSSNDMAKRLAGLTKHDAAEVVFKELGRDASVPELADFMRSHGYGTHIKRQMFINGLRTALDRKPDQFMLVESGIWRLRKWANKPPDKE